MPHQLKNEHLEIIIDLPQENYQGPRFDWTGKIISVKFGDLYVSGREQEAAVDPTQYGRGFYNEFGISSAIGYDETQQADWFHKIGVGLLQKDSGPYDFQKAYPIRPAAFAIKAGGENIQIICRSELHNGYAYRLEKNIQLLNDGFSIHYHLINLGEKPIHTQEYCHNFLAFDDELIGSNYLLKFPFSIQQALFGERVNPEHVVEIGEREFRFHATPQQQFFFSNLSGGKPVPAQWTLENQNSNIGISETGDFSSQSINLWGWTHVISPELFIDIKLAPKQSHEWTRAYRLYQLG